MKLGFFGRFSKNSHISNLIKILPVGAEMFHADRRTKEWTDGQTDMTKLMVAFDKFVNAPTNQSLTAV